MSTGAPVNVQVRFTKGIMSLVERLAEEAIQRAIELTKMDVARMAFDPSASNVPIDTGRLIASFDIASTPRSIVFRWSAVDPRSGFDYAKVQDLGRANMGGHYFSEATAMYTRERLLFHLRNELRSIGG